MSYQNPSAAAEPLEGVEFRKPFKPLGAKFIMETEWSPPVEVVEGIIHEGLILLCGASKLGKSWLALSLCSAVATGRTFLERKTVQGSVLYLAFEDSNARISQRLKKLGEVFLDDDVFRIETHASLVNEGLLDNLRDWVQHSEKPRLIVIDTLQKVRPPVSGRVNIYAEDYRFMSSLKAFADQYHIALVLVHHLRKGKDSDDPYERISGSTALMGAADTCILLDRERGSSYAKLSFTGRDIWEDDVALQMDDGRWSVVGCDAFARADYEKNPIVQTVRHLLSNSFGDTAELLSCDLPDAIVRACGNNPYGSLDASSKAVSAVAADLLKYDGINVARKRLGSKNGFRIWKAQNKEVS